MEKVSFIHIEGEKKGQSASHPNSQDHGSESGNHSQVGSLGHGSK